MKLWGIDLGGTKIECAVIDTEETVIRRRIMTEADKGYDHIISQIKKLITEVSTEIGMRPITVGFATPGVLDPETQLMKNSNTVVINGQPMRSDRSGQTSGEVKLS